jgi:hypothetical protein
MSSNNTPKRPLLPSARTLRWRMAFAAFPIAFTMLAAPAMAHCERHVYNRSSNVWTFEIPQQGYPNVVNYTVEPGQTRSFWINTNTSNNFVRLTCRNCDNNGSSIVVTYPIIRNADWESCYIQHRVQSPDVFHHFIPNFGGGPRRGDITLNDPANGDVILHDCPQRDRRWCIAG